MNVKTVFGKKFGILIHNLIISKILSQFLSYFLSFNHGDFLLIETVLGMGMHSFPFHIRKGNEFW